MPSEKETISFLYAMLKRADLKTVCPSRPISCLSGTLPSTDPHQIDWNALATDVNIPTANAARMRYTRFKAQMDGDGPKANGFANSPKTPKTPKGKKTPTSGKGKPDSFAENDGMFMALCG